MRIELDRNRFSCGKGIGQGEDSGTWCGFLCREGKCVTARPDPIFHCNLLRLDGSIRDARGFHQPGVGGDAGLGVDDVAVGEAEEVARKVAFPLFLSFSYRETLRLGCKLKQTGCRTL